MNSTMLADEGTYISGSIFLRFQELEIEIPSYTIILWFYYVQDKGNCSVSLDAARDGHDMRMAQNLERRKKKMESYLRRQFPGPGCGFPCAAWQSAIPLTPSLRPSASWSAVPTVTQMAMASGCGDITKSGSLWTRWLRTASGGANQDPLPSGFSCIWSEVLLRAAPVRWAGLPGGTPVPRVPSFLSHKATSFQRQWDLGLGNKFILVETFIKSSVFQFQHCWHFGLDNSLSRGLSCAL